MSNVFKPSFNNNLIDTNNITADNVNFNEWFMYLSNYQFFLSIQNIDLRFTQNPKFTNQTYPASTYVQYFYDNFQSFHFPITHSSFNRSNQTFELTNLSEKICIYHTFQNVEENQIDTYRTRFNSNPNLNNFEHQPYIELFLSTTWKGSEQIRGVNSTGTSNVTFANEYITGVNSITYTLDINPNPFGI